MIYGLFLGGILSAVPLRADETANMEGWASVARLQSDEALRAFSGKSREDRYGRSVAILNQQPRSEANVNEAGRLFEELVAENGNDEIGIQAAYQLARIAHVQLEKPEPALAAKRYELLIEQHPGHPLAQAAAVKLAILRLYSLDSDSPPKKRLEAVEPLGAALRDPDAIRDYHLVLADAMGQMGLEPSQALRHLQKAHATSRLSGKLEADVLVRISEIANQTGDCNLAREFAKRFLKQFPHDERASTLRKKWEATP